MKTKIRNLKAEEIECRVGNIYDNGITLLLYKNARVDQTILDETFGIYGWQRSHCCIDGENYCTVSVWDDDKKCWISKQDVGTESYSEKAKGAASDSFKRACFNIGVGRELYTSPFIWLPIDMVQIKEEKGKKVLKDRFSVKSITISVEKVITALEIVNQKSEVVFSYGNVETKTSLITEAEKRALKKEMLRTGVSEKSILERYSLASIDEMDNKRYQWAMTALKKSKTVA